MKSPSPLSTEVTSSECISVLNPGFGSADPRLLKPHPRNFAIYGGDEDVSSLVETIQASGWVKPIVVTPTGTIISGHRRWKAVLTLKWESVPVEAREFLDELGELEALLLENASRFKTIEQKVREAAAWREIEEIKAKQRQQQAATITNQKLSRRNDETLMENFPQASKGTTRDAIASRVGIGSGRTYSKAVTVVTQIDKEVSQGQLKVAQVLRQVLNEHSVDAAHMLLKKSPQERHAIASLIVTGKAKSIFQARQMIRQNNEFDALSQETLGEFAVGDWVEVNSEAQLFDTYIGLRGQVEQMWHVELQISVNFEDGPAKTKFYPHELTLIAKAPPPSPFRVGDIAFVDIDHQEAASFQQRKWNGLWGMVAQIGETGSITVDIGKETLQLLPRDLKPIDAPSSELYQLVERVLRLRNFELDEIEERMLDVLQRREWFTSNQLIHLENIEKLYPVAESYESEKYRAMRCRSP